MSSLSKKIFVVLAVILACLAFYFIFQTFFGPKPVTVDYFTFVEKVREETAEIKEIKVDENFKATIYNYKNKAVYTTSVYSNHLAFYAEVNDIIVKFEGIRPKLILPTYNPGNWFSSFLTIAMFIGVAILIFFVIRQMGGGGSKAMNFGKTQARISENLKVRFDDVAGAEEEKEELAEIVEFLKAPKRFTEMGARIPCGVLLVGPPGTGKTLFAKAIAGEANVPFFSISGSDFVEMFVGVGASRVRDLFSLAKKNSPCIVFIDEIDAVGRQRGAGMGGGHDEREQTLNQLLVQMDGFETNQGIIVIAATNRADILDPALLRPGRFDRQIYVNIPDVRGREAIFKVHSRNKPLSPAINFKTLARITSGFTGADIANVLNEAAIFATRAKRKNIIMKDINEAINKVIMGPQKKSRLVTETDKRITAYHEAGHALLAKLLEHCDPVHEVSIIPRGQAAGYTMTRPSNDDNHFSKNKWLDIITMALGGRVAEEIVITDFCTGASGDIRNVTAIARAMVSEWGMSDLGMLFFGTEREIFIGREFGSHSTCSEVTSAKIDEEMFKIVNSCHERARKLLKANEDKLHIMARVLIEKETIYTEEVDLILQGKSAQEVGDALEARFANEKKHENDIAQNSENSDADNSNNGEVSGAGTDKTKIEKNYTKKI